MKQRIYADNAATTKLDPEAFEAMKPWLLEEYGNASQPYSFSRGPKEALRKARETVAACVNASPEEIYFTSGGTESDNWAVKGVMLSHVARGAAVTSAFEHHAVLNSFKTLERLGCRVAYARLDRTGRVSPDILAGCLTGETKLVSVMYANNELGTIQPVAELCALAHARGALFHTDAVQAAGHEDIDVRELGADMLSASAHKFNGPRGTGFLYVRKGTELPPYMDGGAQERGRRAGTENVAGAVGLAVALKNNVAALRENRARIKAVEETLLRALSENGVPFVRNGTEPFLPGLLSLSFAGKEGEALLHRLDLMGISVSTGSACDGRSAEISHVLKAVGLPEELALGTIRISFGKYNTEEDALAIAGALKRILLD